MKNSWFSAKVSRPHLYRQQLHTPVGPENASVFISPPSHSKNLFLYVPPSCPRPCTRSRSFSSSLWKVPDPGWVLPSRSPERSKMGTSSSVGTSGSAGDTETVGSRLPAFSDALSDLLWSLYSLHHVHYCTNTRDATELPKPHHSLPACNPLRRGRERLICLP